MQKKMWQGEKRVGFEHVLNFVGKCIHFHLLLTHGA